MLYAINGQELSSSRSNLNCLSFFIRLSGQLVTYPLDIVRRRMQMAMITSDGKYLSLRYVSHSAILIV
jgi:hypothetical protein